MQIAMEKTVQRQQREVEDLTAVMKQKYDRLTAYLKERVNEKRVNREKLADLKEDIAKFKLSKESIWDKVTLATTSSTKNSWED
jgi:DNA polymerase II small subunit/DNA polymerase delta subunit B